MPKDGHTPHSTLRTPLPTFHIHSPLKYPTEEEEERLSSGWSPDVLSRRGFCGFGLDGGGLHAGGFLPFRGLFPPLSISLSSSCYFLIFELWMAVFGEGEDGTKVYIRLYILI